MVSGLWAKMTSSQKRIKFNVSLTTDLMQT